MVTKVTEAAPLLDTEKLIKENGTPSDYFLRQWAAQRRINTTVEGTIDELTALQATIDAINAAIAAIQAIDLIAGVGLGGGGDLSGDDRTFDLEDTAVTADTYGDATNVAQITIDGQGRITAAVDIPISGGGGGSGGTSFAWPMEIDNVFDAAAQAWKGNNFEMLLPITMHGIAVFMATTAGHSYRAGVYRLDGSDDVDEITAQSAVTSSPGTFAAGTWLWLPFTADAALVADTTYAIMVGRTDGAGTFGTPISVEGLAAQGVAYPSIPTKPLFLNPVVANGVCNFTVAQPIVGTAANSAASAAAYGLGIKFTVDT